MKMIDGIKNRKTYWLFALLCAAMWGSTGVAAKLAYGAFDIAASDAGSQFLMMGVRFLLAGVLTELLFGLSRGRLPYPQNKAAYGHTALLALTQTVLLYAFFSIGAANASGTMTSMINGTSPFFTILIATFVFRSEAMNGRKALACVLGLGAIVIMNVQGLRGPFSFSWKGEGALLLSQCLAGVSNNILKRFSGTDDPVMLSAWQNFFGGLVLTAIGLLSGGRLGGSALGWAVLAYLAFVSGVAFSIWGMLMKHHSVTRINIFMLANPLFGVMFSALLLQETAQAFSLRTLLACLLICGGILLVNVRKKSKL